MQATAYRRAVTVFSTAMNTDTALTVCSDQTLVTCMMTGGKARLMDGVDAPSVVQDPLCEGRLPAVDVGRDADVAQVRQLVVDLLNRRCLRCEGT